jgi:omega-6 fatty acid desaturase (delta-12 desaturase)
MSNTVTRPSVAEEVRDTWRDLVAKYQRPSTFRSSWQLINTLIPYFALLALMYFSMGISYWLTLALALPAAGFLVRIFIISHDCGHSAFAKSPKANAFWGSITSFLCCNPYYYWKHDHALHHANTGNLDKRGHGDIWTMTVQEYLDAPRGRRIAYRIYRNPLVMFLVGALYVFMLGYRKAPKGAKPKDRRSVMRTNLAIIALLIAVHFTIGLKAFFLLQVPVFAIAAAAGAWLFYVQHQYEGVYWARKAEWDFVTASLDGSSFYKLPAVLNWFTGSIGYHHIHHLSAKIPNYYLARCHRENPVFQKVPEITLLKSLRCLKYRLWDEERGELVGYSRLRELRTS